MAQELLQPTIHSRQGLFLAVKHSPAAIFWYLVYFSADGMPEKSLCCRKTFHRGEETGPSRLGGLGWGFVENLFLFDILAFPLGKEEERFLCSELLTHNGSLALAIADRKQPQDCIIPGVAKREAPFRGQRREAHSQGPFQNNP